MDALLGADLGSMFGAVVSLWLQKHAGFTLINARRGAFTVGVVLMMGMAFVGVVDNPYTAIALLCLLRLVRVRGEAVPHLRRA